MSGFRRFIIRTLILAGIIGIGYLIGDAGLAISIFIAIVLGIIFLCNR